MCKGPVVGGGVAILVTGESEEEPRGVANRTNGQHTLLAHPTLCVRLGYLVTFKSQ